MCGGALCSMWHFALMVDSGGSPQIQEMALTDSRGGPHHVCDVTLCSVWHFDLCREWILEVAPTTCVVWHFTPGGT